MIPDGKLPQKESIKQWSAIVEEFFKQTKNQDQQLSDRS